MLSRPRFQDISYSNVSTFNFAHRFRFRFISVVIIFFSGMHKIVHRARFPQLYKFGDTILRSGHPIRTLLNDPCKRTINLAHFTENDSRTNKQVT